MLVTGHVPEEVEKYRSREIHHGSKEDIFIHISDRELSKLCMQLWFRATTHLSGTIVSLLFLQDVVTRNLEYLLGGVIQKAVEKGSKNIYKIFRLTVF